MISPNAATHRLPVADQATVMRTLASLIGREKLTSACIIMLYLTAAAAGAVIPIALGFIIDGIATGWTIAYVDMICAALLSSILVQLIASRFGHRMGHRFGERSAAYLRERTLRRALRVPLTTIERAGIGDLITRTAGDVAAVADVLRHTGPGVVAACIELAVLVVAAFAVSPALSLFLLIVVPPLLVAAKLYVKHANPAFASERACMAEIAEAVSATEAGAQTVRAHKLEDKRAQVGATAADQHWRYLKRIVNLQTWFMPTLDMAHIIPVIGIFLIGGLWSLSGGPSTGAIVACAMIAYRTAGPIEQVMHSLTELQSASAALARIEGLAEIPVDERDEITEASSIDLREVGFSYETGPEVLNISELSISPGSQVVIVGSSGSGKSTLARIMAGIDRPQFGRATIGGTDSADLKLDCLRKKVVLMTQEMYVFSATLRDNLVLTESTIDDEQVWEALRRVGATWAFELDDELDTLVESRELQLTTGQKQQIALARALVADPEIIIFDESFSALDIQSKGELEANVFSILRGKTVIVIAHQLDMISDQSRVIVLAEGRIIEDGTHEELLFRDGVYSTLWHSWCAKSIQ